MKFIRLLLCFFLLFLFSCKKNIIDITEMRPEYKLTKELSKKLNEETGLVLYSYGINIRSKPQNIKNGVIDFYASYYIKKNRQDVVTIEEVRNLIIYVTESFLNEINSSMLVRDNLDNFPFTNEQIGVNINFCDENRIDLGNGVSGAYFSKGKIKYERYEIHEYRSQYPSIGKHYIIHEETYESALDIVKKKDSLAQRKL